MFSDFDEYLKLPLPSDHWYDVGVEYVSGLVEKFQDSDWQALSDALCDRPAEWRTKCAEAIDVSSNKSAMHILLNLLAAPEDDVVIAAADSLRSREVLKNVVSEDEIARLRKIMAVGSPPARAVVGDLLNKLNREQLG
ncbi:hypothetical protein [Chromobacterium vaccinii]|uniref:hypothetical protein n=1 Tax=Chromobacterium vaccinii TaxID=1108595 RepID=UPI0011AB37E4|nr:hypothetical protein [Chromobacterium vaccinii]